MCHPARMNLQLLPPFSRQDDFHVVIESPRGSTLKLKYSAEWEAMGITRPLPVGLMFPFDSGFVPSTLNVDGDPLDAFVVWDTCAYPGVVVVCRALGVLQVEQNAANFDSSRRIRNDRIIALPTEARREAGEWQTIDDVPQRLREEWIQFTIASTALEGKDAAALGWGGCDEALSLIARTAAVWNSSASSSRHR